MTGSADLTIFREAMLLKTMDHPNIISLEGVCKDAKGHLNLLLSPFVGIQFCYHYYCLIFFDCQKKSI